MNEQVTYIFILIIISHKDSFCHRGKSKLGIGLFIHELVQVAFDHKTLLARDLDRLRLQACLIKEYNLFRHVFV